MKQEERTDSDSELVARCRKGDVKAFEEMVHKYQKRAFNIAHKIVGDFNEAAEIVQDAFMSAYRNIHKFKGKSKFSTWFYTIIVNTSRNKLKQIKIRRTREVKSIDNSVENHKGEVKKEYASDNPSAHDTLEQHERNRKVWECLNNLDAEFRETIVLRDIEGFSYSEISALLTVAIGTVRSRIHRAREAVKDCLKERMGEL